jgi:NAD(P)-dependent dehydrogenase (short-subunit alcohol dehydrogenase family)
VIAAGDVLPPGRDGGAAVFRKLLDSKYPAGHGGEPDDIGSGIVYLVTDESKFVTDTELIIGGGYAAQRYYAAGICDREAGALLLL